MYWNKIASLKQSWEVEKSLAVSKQYASLKNNPSL